MDALRDLLLQPLGPGGSLRYVTASFDLEADAPVEMSFEQTASNAILLLDGTFLQRPELRRMFDFVLFVDVPASVAKERAILRDAASSGGAHIAAELYDRRYEGAFQLYCAEARPHASADAVLDNSNFGAPALRFSGY